MKIEISQLTMSDWELYRSLRLRSLRDSPSSFGSSYNSEVDYPEEKWRFILASSHDNNQRSLPLVAIIDDEPVGIGLGYIHDFESKMGYVYQMWIQPEARHRGLGRRLLQSIIVWAKSLTLKSLSLSVTNVESTAIHLYLSCGFKPIEDLENRGLDFILKLQTENKH